MLDTFLLSQDHALIAPMLALICVAFIVLVWLPKLAPIFAGAGIILAISFAPASVLLVGAGLTVIACMIARPKALELAMLICAGFATAGVILVLANAALHLNWTPLLFWIVASVAISGMATGFSLDNHHITPAAFCCVGVAAISIVAPALTLTTGTAAGLAVLICFILSLITQKDLS
jgi:hypothetical protein